MAAIEFKLLLIGFRFALICFLTKNLVSLFLVRIEIANAGVIQGLFSKDILKIYKTYILVWSVFI